MMFSYLIIFQKEFGIYVIFNLIYSFCERFGIPYTCTLWFHLDFKVLRVSGFSFLQGAGANYTMTHIKEFDSSHRLVGQQGIRLKVSLLCMKCEPCLKRDNKCYMCYDVCLKKMVCM